MTTIFPADEVITVTEFAARMAAFNKTAMATVEAVTPPHNMRKTGNPLAGRVMIHSVVNGVIGSWNYESAVNHQRMREENPQTQEEADAVPYFESLPRDWGRRIPESALVAYNSKEYLEVQVNKWLSRTYLVDGRAATPEEVAIIREHSRAKKDGERQELEKPIILRDYTLTNIRSIKVGGKMIQVVPA